MTPPDIRPGSDSRRNWQPINAGLDSLRLRHREENRLRESVENLRRVRSRELAEDFPFRVYTQPNSSRVLEDPDWWRKFTVQHGYVNNVRTSGCDNADNAWDGSPGNVFPGVLEIPVNAGQAAYYIWVESSITGSVTANTIQSGPAPWPGFPDPNGPGKARTLIAKIDTLTNQAYKTAIVRQSVYEDISLAGPSGGAGVTYEGDWDGTRAYTRNQMVTIRGGISGGLYICVVNAPIGTPAPNDPTLGVFWVSLGRGSALGQWL